MTTTQRPRTSGQSTPPSGSDPTNRGLILIAVGVVLAVILLVKAGGVGFDSSAKDVKIGAGEEKVTTTTVTSTTTAAQQAPQTVQVVAANGSGKSGVAAKVAQRLAQAGYTQVVATNTNKPVTTSSVIYAAGYEANAREIAKTLGLPDTSVRALAAGESVAKDQPPTTGVVVAIGPELATSLEATPTTKPGSTATTTVAGGGTATTVAGRSTTTVAGRSTTTVAGKTATTATTTPAGGTKPRA